MAIIEIQVPGLDLDPASLRCSSLFPSQPVADDDGRHVQAQDEDDQDEGRAVGQRPDLDDVVVLGGHDVKMIRAGP